MWIGKSIEHIQFVTILCCEETCPERVTVPLKYQTVKGLLTAMVCKELKQVLCTYLLTYVRS
jgi:hypothetical protein